MKRIFRSWTFWVAVWLLSMYLLIDSDKQSQQLGGVLLLMLALMIIARRNT